MFNPLKLPLFLAVCACLGRVLLCAVSPPTNLTVSCHNFENVVYWNYSHPHEDTEFTVTIKRYIGEENSVRTVENYLDITSHTENLKNVYSVSVEARPKGSENTSSSGDVRFTYDEDFPVTTKCVLDFPDVNISAFHHSFELYFDHPYHVYNSVDLNETFAYTVTCNETECGRSECFLEEECTEIIHLPESLYGRCFNVHIVGMAGSIPLETSKEFCDHVEVSPQAGVTLITILVCIGVAVLLTLIVAGVMMYKNVTRTDSQSAIISKILNMVNSSPSIIVPEQPAVSEVRSISHRPLLTFQDEVLSTSTSPTSPPEITHLTIQPTTEEQEQSGNEDDEQFDGSSSGFTFDVTGYDSKKFIVEMSPGDDVEAYRP